MSDRISRRVFILIILDLLTIFAAIAIHYWSIHRFFIQIDYAYNVESAFQLFQGKMPYRDFFLVLPPGLFFLMQLVMHLVGGYGHNSQMLVAYGTTAVSVFLLLRIQRKFFQFSDLWPNILVLPFLFRGHAYYPIPSYDMTAMCAILFSLYMILTMIFASKRSLLLSVVTGISLIIPVLIKQNYGILFLGSASFFITLGFIRKQGAQAIHSLAPIFMTAYSLLGGFILWLMVNNALGQAYYQLFVLPSQTRNVGPIIQLVLSEYKNGFGLFVPLLLPILGIGILVWAAKYIPSSVRKGVYLIIPGAIIGYLGWYFYTADPHHIFEIDSNLIILSWFIASCLVIITTVWGIWYSKQSQLISLVLPVPALMTIFATFMSYGMVGSSYSGWAMWVLIIGYGVFMVRKYLPNLVVMGIVTPLIISVSYILWGSLKLYDYHRYVYNIESYTHKATYPSLGDMELPGDYLPNMERMLTVVSQIIPMEESVVFTPGEDPFYALTKRKNPLPYIQYFDATENIKTPEQLISTLNAHKIQWIVVKLYTQHTTGMGFIHVEARQDLLLEEYVLIQDLPGYQIYRRK